MNNRMTAWIAALLAVVSAGSLQAHHSLANFDTTKAVRVKGTVVAFQQINPHSFIFLDEANAGGQTRRWAIEGPSLLQLSRRGAAKDIVKPGDVIEVCGYVPKETTIWQIASPDPSAASISGRLINAELLVMPDGHEESWGGYGVRKCYASQP
jgi:Family of unknown function (DUF6152)